MGKLKLVGEDEGGEGGLVPHTHPEEEISDGTLFARLSAAEAVTGAWDFSAGRLRLTQGPDAAKPGAGNAEGSVYWASDTDRLYVWDGGAWKDMGEARRLRGGPDASKPAAGNAEGDAWWASDSDKLYVWEGSFWKEIGAASGDGLGTVQWKQSTGAFPSSGQPVDGAYTDMRLESGGWGFNFGAAGVQTVAQTFRQAFTQTPRVVLGMERPGSAAHERAAVALQSVSVTGFTIAVESDGARTVRGEWIALGR